MRTGFSTLPASPSNYTSNVTQPDIDPAGLSLMAQRVMRVTEAAARAKCNFCLPLGLCILTMRPLSCSAFLRQRDYRGERLSLVNNAAALTYSRHSMQTRFEMRDSLGCGGTLQDMKIGLSKDLTLILGDTLPR